MRDRSVHEVEPEAAPPRLAVYGSLRPGEQHHDLVSDLEVVARGWLTGQVREVDGYPVLRLAADGERVAVAVLGGAALADRWPELDRFEGPAYRREQVVVTLDDGGRLEAECYLGVED
jgi:gamma-glutamylcyclotransferase (GGCT)/AIG2-like uncharacterized protein YtfP